MDEPRRIAIHRSLNRAHLLLGAERSLVLMAGLITALLIFSGNISVWSITLAIVFWSGSFWALVRMAKADSQMSQVYQRHIRYRAYYSAHSCIEAPLPGGGSPKA
ncbi:conjugal transfer protein TrbD [Chitinimonas sp. BJB300]|uniref:conjugal transfer protein TrbD n=1 Tax=Chitinimonas sp. BJB300 TaxID=1559339 RepID=UPI000C11DEF0|nr:conjugal transfer protein TrbD [Chitinimonas sp. BJB300]PHV13507.1 conjugal transfer protein TrbD [Chitinimonas sp. BJB300]TSJ89809.1 conjugal transfer protein TrbD [Chitinimonas sp. BJB300]